MRWIKRFGLYKLKAPLLRGDWMVIVDFSIQTGKSKCLVILGIPYDKFHEDKILSLEDMTIVSLGVHEKCNGEAVEKALEYAERRLGRIVGICSDQGSEINVGVKSFQKNRHYSVYNSDITHKVAIFLKQILENNPLWNEFCSQANLTRSQVQQTSLAHYKPPSQRSKCRFMNLEPLVNWGVKMLDHLHELKQDMSDESKATLEQFKWLEKYSGLIQECSELIEVAQISREVVRTQGYCTKTTFLLEERLLYLSHGSKAIHLAEGVLDFVGEQVEKVPKGERRIGSSEIIESLFGKLKAIEGEKNKEGFTGFVLSASACVGRCDTDFIVEAMKNTTHKEVLKWEAENIGQSTFALRQTKFSAKTAKIQHPDSQFDEEEIVGRKLTGSISEDTQKTA